MLNEAGAKPCGGHRNARVTIALLNDRHYRLDADVFVRGIGREGIRLTMQDMTQIRLIAIRNTK